MSWYHDAIVAIDPAAEWRGYPTGLRDRALLALLAAGISVPEVYRLTAAHVYQAPSVPVECPACGVVYAKYPGPSKPTSLYVQWREREGRRHVHVPLAPLEGAQVLAYLLATRAWGEAVPLIRGDGGRLTIGAMHSIVHQYRHRYAPARSA